MQLKWNYKFDIRVNLDGVYAGEIRVSIPRRLYKQVNHSFLYEYFQIEMEMNYPEIAKRIDDAITNAIYSMKISGLDRVKFSDDPIAMWDNSSLLMTNYRDAEDYIAKVERRYELISIWDEEMRRISKKMRRRRNTLWVDFLFLACGIYYLYHFNGDIEKYGAYIFIVVVICGIIYELFKKEENPNEEREVDDFLKPIIVKKVTSPINMENDDKDSALNSIAKTVSKTIDQSLVQSVFRALRSNYLARINSSYVRIETAIIGPTEIIIGSNYNNGTYSRPQMQLHFRKDDKDIEWERIRSECPSLENLDSLENYHRFANSIEKEYNFPWIRGSVDRFKSLKLYPLFEVGLGKYNTDYYTLEMSNNIMTNAIVIADILQKVFLFPPRLSNNLLYLTSKSGGGMPKRYYYKILCQIEEKIKYL